MSEAESRCTLLQQEMFSFCNGIINPLPFISDCVYDLCYCNEEDQETCFCNSIANYARACADSGIVIPEWRNSLCSKKLYNIILA